MSKEVVKFTKKQILESETFKNRKDLVNAVINDGSYTIEEVETAIEKYLRKKVN